MVVAMIGGAEIITAIAMIFRRQLASTDPRVR
jgi:hypothetical protein